MTRSLFLNAVRFSVKSFVIMPDDFTTLQHGHLLLGYEKFTIDISIRSFV